MNASAVPVSVPVVLTVLHLSLAEMPAPGAGFGQVGSRLEMGSDVVDGAGAHERHVKSWRASLGHTYAEWSNRVPGED